MRKLFFFLYTLFFLPFAVNGQQDSCTLQISLLTCSPGEELYSTFGHSALRVQDGTAGTNLVFNYGSFQFDEDFYAKFIKGKLLYFVSVEEFADFTYAYQYESRSIQEQILLLTCAEKQQLYTALQVNALEENRYYRYDFLLDNCTTRLRDIVAKNTSASVQFGNILPKDVPTFRNLLYTYLNNGGQHWSKLGIDILLGRRLDRKVTHQQAMFLPDYLLKGFDKAVTGDRRLAAPPKTILTMPSAIGGSTFFHPMVVFSLLLLLLIILSFIPNKRVLKALEVFDFLFFFMLGLAGCLLLFMWFGTDHAVCRDNFNLLWALPTHVIAAFFLWRKNNWVQYYLLVTLIIQSVLLIGWIFLPQQLNLALLPILLLILLRSWLLILKPHVNAPTT